MNDKNGKPLKVGDRIRLEATVKSLAPDSQQVNVVLDKWVGNYDKGGPFIRCSPEKVEIVE